MRYGKRRGCASGKPECRTSLTILSLSLIRSFVAFQCLGICESYRRTSIQRRVAIGSLTIIQRMNKENFSNANEYRDTILIVVNTPCIWLFAKP